MRGFLCTGATAYLRTIEDLLRTPSMLDRASTPSEASQDVEALLEAIQRLGTFSLEPRLHDKTFQYDIRLSSAK